MINNEEKMGRHLPNFLPVDLSVGGYPNDYIRGENETSLFLFRELFSMIAKIVLL